MGNATHPGLSYPAGVAQFPEARRLNRLGAAGPALFAAPAEKEELRRGAGGRLRAAGGWLGGLALSSAISHRVRSKRARAWVGFRGEQSAPTGSGAITGSPAKPGGGT